MGIEPDSLLQYLHTMGTAHTGPFCIPLQHQVCPIMFQGGHGRRLPGRRLPHTMVRGTNVPVPSNTAASQDCDQDNAVQYRCNPYHPLVAEATVVRSPIRNSTRSLPPSSDTISPGSPPSRCSVPSPDGVEDNPRFREVLEHAQKPSTSCLY